MILSERNRWRWLVLKYTMTRLRGVPPIAPKTCNICGFSGVFHPFGWPVRPDSRCPRCASLERHREFKLWVDQAASAFSGKRVLHFAPEPVIKELVQPVSSEYRTADIDRAGTDLVLDIESIALPSSSVDAVICSHVLEHVDDKRALSELYRILSPGGMAVLMTPIVEGWAKTYENAAITEPAERLQHFGQANHVRYYGADIRDRIRGAGFNLIEFTAEEPYVSRHGLLRGSKVFIARKPSND